MPHELMVDVPTDALLVYCERLHRELHAVERRRLPDEIGGEVVGAVRGNSIVLAQFECNLVGDVYTDSSVTVPSSGGCDTHCSGS